MPQRESPVLAGDRGEHRREMVGRVPVVVVEIGDLAAVRRIAQNRLERAPRTGSRTPRRCAARSNSRGRAPSRQRWPGRSATSARAWRVAPRSPPPSRGCGRGSAGRRSSAAPAQTSAAGSSPSRPRHRTASAGPRVMGRRVAMERKRDSASHFLNLAGTPATRALFGHVVQHRAARSRSRRCRR